MRQRCPKCRSFISAEGSCRRCQDIGGVLMAKKYIGERDDRLYFHQALARRKVLNRKENA